MKIAVPRLYSARWFSLHIKNLYSVSQSVPWTWLCGGSFWCPPSMRLRPNIGVRPMWVYRHCIIKWSPGQFYLEHCSPPTIGQLLRTPKIFAYRPDNNKRPESLFPLDTQIHLSLLRHSRERQVSIFLFHSSGPIFISAWRVLNWFEQIRDDTKLTTRAITLSAWPWLFFSDLACVWHLVTPTAARSTIRPIICRPLAKESFLGCCCPAGCGWKNHFRCRRVSHSGADGSKKAWIFIRYLCDSTSSSSASVYLVTKIYIYIYIATRTRVCALWFHDLEYIYVLHAKSVNKDQRTLRAAYNFMCVLCALSPHRWADSLLYNTATVTDLALI